MRVNVYFRLLLEALHAGIEIDYITFDEGSSRPRPEHATAGRGHSQRALDAGQRRRPCHLSAGGNDRQSLT